MPNINLTTEDFSKEGGFALGGGTISLLVVIVLLLGGYGFLLFAKKEAVSETENIKSKYQEEYDVFLSGGGSEVIDFKNRSDIAKKLLVKNRSMSEALMQIESSILPSVYLESFSYDESKKTVTLNCVGDKFETVAKQILSFKSNPYFESVAFGQSVIDSQTNKLKFSFDFKIN